MKTKTFFMLLLALFAFPAMGTAADVTLAWDPVTGTNIAGYQLYVHDATESDYDYSNPQARVEEPSCTLTFPDNPMEYYFVVRAIDADGNQSGDSNEVCWNPSGAPCASRPTLALGGDSGDDAGANGCFVSTLIED
jgi:hypothetical protein